MQVLNLPNYEPKLRCHQGKDQIYDPYRRCYVALTPEEWVRQCFLAYLHDHMNYPHTSIAVEVGVSESLRSDRVDGLIYAPGGRVLGLLEFKAPSVTLSQRTLDQMLRYNVHLHAPLLFMSNGLEHMVIYLDYANNRSEMLQSVPAYQEAVAMIEPAR